MGYAELASAVSNAGGLGIITALIWPEPEGLRQEIRKCRKMTSRPFAVNITLLPALVPPDYEGYAQVVIDEGVKIVETAGNSPGPVISKLKKAGVIVLHKCTTIRHAQSAVKLGVDFLSIDGFECAGYVKLHFCFRHAILLFLLGTNADVSPLLETATLVSRTLPTSSF